MELRKIRNIDNRPLDYLKERNCRSTIQHRSDYGKNLIGWQANKLRDNMPIKASYANTIRFLDKSSKNNFPRHSGIFVHAFDKKLKLSRGYPFNKLDMRRQRKLVKETDMLLYKNKRKTASMKTITTPRSKSGSSKTKNQLNAFVSLKPNSDREDLVPKQVLKETKRIYDKIYEEKLRAHFWVPYPKFPYNLDKDTIIIQEPKLAHKTMKTFYKPAKAHQRIGSLVNTILQEDLEYYRTHRIDKNKGNMNIEEQRKTMNTVASVRESPAKTNHSTTRPGTRTATRAGTSLSKKNDRGYTKSSLRAKAQKQLGRVYNNEYSIK